MSTKNYSKNDRKEKEKILEKRDQTEDKKIAQKEEQRKSLKEKMTKCLVIISTIIAIGLGPKLVPQNRPDPGQTMGNQQTSSISGDPEPDKNDEQSTQQVTESANKKSSSKVDVKKGQDLKDEVEHTITEKNVNKGEVKVEKEEATKLKIEDNSEKEITQKAVEEAKNQNKEIVQGEIRKENGDTTGEKITAITDKNENKVVNKAPEKTNNSTQSQNKNKLSLDEMNKAVESKSNNNNTRSSKESAMSEEELARINKIANEEINQTKTQPSAEAPQK